MSQDLQKALDRTVLGLFQSYASTFLTTIYCGLRFSWDSSIPTACTNGINLRWNPDWFFSLSEPMRITVLAHELWHVAYMHMARIGDRQYLVWIKACDYALNIILFDHGYTFDKDANGQVIGLLDERFRDMSAEQIYEQLLEEGDGGGGLAFGADFEGGGEAGGDSPMTAEQQAEVMALVVRAHTMSQMNGKEAGQLPGDFETLIEDLLNPRLPWEVLLSRWFTERSEEGSNWRRPNRRYQDMYLPSRGSMEGLEHLLWALDTSGSLNDHQVRVMNSEMAGVKEQCKPERMTMVSFDTKIQNQWEFVAEDELKALKFHGRGGTNMHPVFELAAELKPAVLIMLSDMDCEIPDPIPGVEVLWLCFDRPNWVPPYGTVIHVDSIPSTAA